MTKLTTAERVVLAVVIELLAWASAGGSVLLFWLASTKWPFHYDNIPLVLLAVVWVTQGYMRATLRKQAEEDGLL